MPPTRARKTNVHDVDTSFVGRAADLAAIVDVFERGARLVTLTGPGGMGKTRLAVRYARGKDGAHGLRGASGAWFCDLTEATTAAGIEAVVAGVLGVALDPGAGAENVASVLARAIARKGRVLLVLDNFEHLVAHGAGLVVRWMRAAPQARFLVTSRVALGLAEEHVWSVPPLAAADAAELFLERARRVRPDLPVATVDAATDIVDGLEGMPLAIELAASRMVVLSYTQLRERLRRPLEVLSSARGGRHASMRRTVLDSVQLLSARERACFVACACFRGGFALQAIEAVAGGSGVLEAIDLLSRSSLLRAQPMPELGGEVRLSLFETIREVAAELLEADPDRDALLERHAAFYAELAETSGSEGATDPRLPIEIENLQVAHAHALKAARAVPSGPGARRALSIALALDPVLSARGLTALCLHLLDEAIEAGVAAGAPDDRLAQALQARGLAQRELGDTRAARASLEKALALADPAARPQLAAMAHTRIGEILDVAGATAEAHRRFDSALALLATAPEGRTRHFGEAEIHLRRAHAHRREGELARAEVAVAESVARYRRLGHDEGLAAALYEAAVVAMFQDRGDVAMERFDEGLAIAHRARARALVGALTTARGGLLQEQGALDEALRHHAEAARIFGELGSRYRETSALYYLATAYLERGDAREAGRLLGLALDRVRGVGAPRYEALIEGCRAVALAALGDHAAALAVLEGARRAQALCASEPALAATVAIHALTLGLRTATTEPTDAARQGAELEARRLATAHPSDDSRFALRALLAAPPGRARRDLRIGEEGRSFVLPGRDEPVDLSRRVPLGRILVLLARQRREAPGEPVGIDEIVRAGWPDERIETRAALNRAYVALATLRKLGLRELLQSTGGGYCIDPAVGMRLPHDADTGFDRRR
jgi:predicted ATPase